MYSTVDEIREVFEENDIGNEAVITDAEIIKIIIGVDAEIDAALYRRSASSKARRRRCEIYSAVQMARS